ncbi:CPBP family intramembrane glutamic endopeptidase [Streptomyces sp. NPDC058632]|uniref:CPBP family intramembrane glutamic endopeptidase n=1 Tax=unclassified Streptomyces TaxID=2593676 RepID=UPI0036613515
MPLARSVPQLLKAPFSQAPFAPTGRVRPAWVRPVVLVVLFVAVTGLGAGVTGAADNSPVLALPAGAAVAALALTLYAAVVRRLEQRPVSELDPMEAVTALRTGTLAGLGLFTATLLLIVLFGGAYGTRGGVSVGGALTLLGTMAGVAVAEELLFRGVVFRLVEEVSGTWVALAFSSVLFGGLHLVNEKATVWGALAIAVEAGLMLGVVYAATRTLWLPIGLHFGWNFALTGIFGTTVSGSEGTPDGLLQGVLTGPEALTGGDFGPEASIMAILACSVPTVVCLRLAGRRGRIRPRRPLRPAPADAA